MAEKLYDAWQNSSGISTDTRQIQAGNLFFALRGPNFNANTFAAEALKKGASFVVVDDPDYAISSKCILVENALTALQDLARYYRRQLNIPVIGITGSNGKTTTKELMFEVLNRKYVSYATKGNLNNHIGVPLSVLSIEPKHEIAIIEMGANRVGDIRLLCSIANPTHGLITNIGKAHIGEFGGQENIVRGKSELYEHIITHQGVVFINTSQSILYNMAKRFSNPYFYPEKGSYCEVEWLGAEPHNVYRFGNEKPTITRLIGHYNFNNIASALCVGKFFDVAPEDANAAIAAYVPENMRSQILTKEKNTIILDAYNANPDSMKAAVENLQHMKHGKKCVILGDMYELGESAEVEHRSLGALLRKCNFDLCLLCGKDMHFAAKEVPGSVYFENRNQLSAFLKENNLIDCLILIKGSRGMGLEKIVDDIN
ncbi:MAG: UDP-N-acetylmuramoyl-tripeptide--D-alanyl-D-alanine ligase [Cyclobacteriaceae bacterium]|nr:UDP-N-acetylmuramoyl-tripeptide--D-alanyl-D-alanine ligase [Cyclobacteriaceae bacterium]